MVMGWWRRIREWVEEVPNANRRSKKDIGGRSDKPGITIV